MCSLEGSGHCLGMPKFCTEILNFYAYVNSCFEICHLPSLFHISGHWPEFFLSYLFLFPFPPAWPSVYLVLFL